MKIIANRLTPYLKDFIQIGQTCSVPNGNILQNLAVLRDTIIQIENHPKESAALLALDFEKKSI